MIKKLTLKNFRRHESLDVEFSDGLNVLRGNNESGKSTVLEGVLYALYGAKALRNTLADTVTWGKKEADLKVSLVINVGGVDYTFSRSKSGAEVNAPGVKVTGQSEVTAYAAEKLGADAKTAALLMLSSQSGLRGALDDGPAAVSTLMGKLADFDMIDRILESAQNNLSLGAEGPLKDKITRTQEAKDLSVANCPQPHVWHKNDTEIDRFAILTATTEKQNNDVLVPAFSAAEKAYSEGFQSNLRHATITQNLDTLEDRSVGLRAKIVQASKAVVFPSAEVLSSAKARVALAGTHAQRVTAHAWVMGLPAYPEVFWDEPEAKLHAEIESLRAKETALVQKAQAALSEAKALRRGLIKGGACPTCGHDAKNDDHVKQHNDGIEAAAVEQEKLHNEAIAEKNRLAPDLGLMLGIWRDAQARDPMRRKLDALGVDSVVIDAGVVPAKITWNGEAPGKSDLQDANAALQAIEDQITSANRAQGQVAAFEVTLAGVEKEIAASKALLDSFSLIDMGPLSLAYNETAQAVGEAKRVIDESRSEAQRLSDERLTLKKLYDDGVREVTLQTEKLEEYQADLKTLYFNNALVKKLKTLKPAITDHLWNSVLSAVSNFFSTLRGEQSVVTKDGGGFKVNGQSIDSLSGSTLDVLALSIRVALTKTFIPHATFMVLDEPFAACDTYRTGEGLGFMQSTGFTQVLMASHDPLSESVAGLVIQLGE